MPKQKSTADKPAKAAAAKSADKRPPAKKSERAALPQVDAPRSNGARASLSADEMHRLIQEAAYFKAKARNFAPGHEVQDWIEAESEVRLRIESGRSQSERRSV
jgi:hypothetical protein